MSASFIKAFAVGAITTLLGLSLLGLGGAWLLVPSPLQRFATEIYSFELAQGWRCTRENTEFVCKFGNPPSDAIIITTMKYRGPEDTALGYERHLRSPMKAVGRDGNAEFVSVERVTIGGKDWVEGVLIDSEVFNYETTYLATNTADAAILITFSVHKKFRAVRSEVLRRMMQSLVVYQRAS